MQFGGFIYTKIKFIVYLKFRVNWVTRILHGTPTVMFKYYNELKNLPQEVLKRPAQFSKGGG